MKIALRNAVTTCLTELLKNEFCTPLQLAKLTEDMLSHSTLCKNEYNIADGEDGILLLYGNALGVPENLRAKELKVSKYLIFEFIEGNLGTNFKNKWRLYTVQTVGQLQNQLDFFIHEKARVVVLTENGFLHFKREPSTGLQEGVSLGYITQSKVEYEKPQFFLEVHGERRPYTSLLEVKVAAAKLCKDGVENIEITTADDEVIDFAVHSYKTVTSKAERKEAETSVAILTGDAAFSACRYIRYSDEDLYKGLEDEWDDDVD